MNEEQFVSIDLDDDNVCSVCKLGTEKETLSFCHVCFELNIEGNVLKRVIFVKFWSQTALLGAECELSLPESFRKGLGLKTCMLRKFSCWPN